jgi:hypothetical protein
MLDLTIMLEQAGLDPASTLVVRHAPIEKDLKRMLLSR